MRIHLNPSTIRTTKWYEYGVRFLLGGVIPVIAGIIAKQAGPVFGGLFLAFPAILPASATLIEKHERKRKESKGLEGTRRGRQAAGVDAAGAAMGSIGLMVFALLIWRFLPYRPISLVLAAATVMWFTVSVLIWRGRKVIRIRSR
jgi:hypothetical protein